MSKRFTETAKWVDPWFRKLTAAQKLLWQYLCDNCDQAGVIDLDLELAAFQIGAKLTPADVEAMGDRVANVRGKIWVRGFVRFQYGKLSEDCKPHAPAIASLQRHGITLAQAEGIESLSNTLSIPTMVGFESLQDKDKDKDKEKDKEEDKDNALSAAKTDADWLAALAASPAYSGIDVDREYAKAGTWCQTSRRKLTRKFFVNWLNRCDRAMDAKSAAHSKSTYDLEAKVHGYTC